MSGPQAVKGRLRVLVVAEDQSVLDLCRVVFAGSGDEPSLHSSLSSGIFDAQSNPPDVAFVDVAMEQRAALTLVHHVKAVASEADVFAMARPGALDAASQAISLGASGVIVLPPSGDELLNAANGVRARREAALQRTQLKTENDSLRRALGYVARLANLADCGDGDNTGAAIIELFREASGMPRVALFTPTFEGAEELRLLVSSGNLVGVPAFSDEMGLMRYARESSLEVIPLLAGRLSMGHLLLGGRPWPEGTGQVIRALASQAATTLMLAAERERAGRGTIKDGATSAYTFAYFVDIAGREIDKAKRHGRRFALATISTHNDLPGEGPPSRAVDVADTVLAMVRDSDVLARIDEHEFYLLLPETGGFGAQACRRRVLALGSPPNKLRGVSIGVATFPHDGADLLRLLRVAKRRADSSRGSVVNLLRLQQRTLPEITDALLWDADIAQNKLPACPEVPRVLELPLVDVLNLVKAALAQGARGGTTRVVVAQRDGLGFAAAVRAFSGANREGVHFVDIRHRDGCEDIEVLTVVAEHGAYALLGRVDHGKFQGLHAADPLFADLLTQRLAELSGVRLMD